MGPSLFPQKHTITIPATIVQIKKSAELLKKTCLETVFFKPLRLHTVLVKVAGAVLKGIPADMPQGGKKKKTLDTTFFVLKN